MAADSLRPVEAVSAALQAALGSGNDGGIARRECRRSISLRWNAVSPEGLDVSQTEFSHVFIRSDFH